MALINGTSGDDILVGTPADDEINGLGGEDELIGLEGNDSLSGGDGDDLIEGGAGNDRLDGGAGFDIVYYGEAPGAVFVNLAAGTASGGGGNDTLVSVEWVWGSAFDDVMVGSDGQDAMHGQQGDDMLTGGAGNDFFRGNAGDDVIDGGEGFDRISHFGDPSATAGVIVSLLLQGAPQNTGQGWDTYIGIESLSGSPFDDQLTGDHGVNWLVGGDAAGNDSLFGLGGDDLLEVGRGDHLLDGGGGEDTLSFQGLGTIPGAVTASLLLQGTAQDTGQGMMTLAGIENLSGTPFDDSLTGDSGDNMLLGHDGTDTLIGGGGDDTLYGDGAIMSDDPGKLGLSGPPVLFGELGFAGDDLLEGGDGDDMLIGGRGDDHLDGGDGTDLASWVNASGSVAANLTLGTASGADGNDTMVSIENLGGSRFDDHLIGDGADNVIFGARGDDLIEGLGGRDFVLGQPGDDIIEGGDGDDFLLGQEGNDTVYGGDGNDRLDGEDGVLDFGSNDILIGGRGDDLLIGGGGMDVLTGGQGRDIFEFGPGSGHDRITDFANAQDKIKFESGSGVDDFSDLLITKAGKDVLISWANGSASILLERTNIHQIDSSDFIFGDGTEAQTLIMAGGVAGGGPSWLSQPDIV